MQIETKEFDALNQLEMFLEESMDNDNGIDLEEYRYCRWFAKREVEEKFNFSPEKADVFIQKKMENKIASIFHDPQ